MKKICFVPVEDRLYDLEGTPIMVNTFKRYHPDIELKILNTQITNEILQKNKVNWYQAKPFFAELFENDYDLVVNMDADHVVTGRMVEVFDILDYDVALPSNLNDYENAEVNNITKEMFLQAGIVASTSKEFWKRWRIENRQAMQYKYAENSIVNLLIYNIMPELKLKMIDKDKNYYGCKSLNREKEFYIENDKLMCRSEEVLCYHHAKGQAFPKLDFKNMPFTQEVKDWLYKISL